jgi:hypothetical protein
MAEKDNIEYAKQQIAALNARNVDGYLSRYEASKAYANISSRFSLRSRI